jgi:hypothetical protein
LNPLVIPGKPELEFRLLENTDYSKLQEFCNRCKEQGWHNNSSFDAIKLDKMSMPYGRFFIGYDHNKNIIFNLAGVHHLPEIADNAWRCLFRGAQLPGYSISGGFTKNIFKTGYQLSYVLPMQMEFIKYYDPAAEFYMTTNNQNTSVDNAGKSKRMDIIMSKTLAKIGVLDKFAEDFELFYTQQTIWKINEEHYHLQRSLYNGP